MIGRSFRCSMCPELVKSRSKVVIYRGPPGKVDVLFILESPGETEDKEGLPLVGPSRRPFDEAMKETGLDCLYAITNVIWCHPLGNRAPTYQEINNCSKHLDDLIKEKCPVVVVPVGGTALQAILGQEGIMVWNAEVIKKGPITYIPMVHPSAVLRHPEWQGMMVTAMRKVKEVLENVGSDW